MEIKFNLKFNLFIYLLFFINIVYTQTVYKEKQDPFSLRIYQIIKFDGAAKTWQQSADEAEVNGGYLATITTQYEQNFINSMLENEDLNLYFGCNGVSNNLEYRWMTGPEKNHLVYSRNTNKCYSYCNWENFQPDGAFSQQNQFCTLRSGLGGVWSDDSGSQVIIGGYIMEIGGLDVSIDTNSNSFKCRIPYQDGNFAGQWDITISDKLKSYSIYNYHANVPYISTVIPSYQTNGLVTINGQSFGRDAIDFQVSFSTRNIACTGITASGISSLSTKIAFLIPETNEFVLNPSIVNRLGSVGPPPENQFQYEGYTLSWYTFNSQPQMAMLQKLSGKNFCLPVTKTGTSFYLKGGINKNLLITDTSAATPTCSPIIGCNTVDSSLGLFDVNTNPAYFSINSNVLGGVRTDIDFCNYLYSFIPQPVGGPVFREPQTLFVPTDGGDVYLKVNNLKMPYNSYVVKRDGVTLATQGVPLYKPFVPEPLVKVYIPSGTGATPKVLKLLIDGVENAQTTTTVAYQPPFISSATKTPTNGLLAASVEGSNFGVDENKCSIRILPDDGSPSFYGTDLIIHNHYQLSFNVPPGTGKYKIQIIVDGQVSNSFQSGYTPPIITMQSTTTNQATIKGIGFGPDPSKVLILFNNIRTNVGPFISFSDNEISFTIPSDVPIPSPSLIIEVNGQQSDPVPLNILPYILNVTPKPVPPQITSDITISGYFFKGKSQTTVDFGPLKCPEKEVTSTRIICTLQPWTGLKIKFIVSVDGVFSESFINFGPMIQVGSHNGTSILVSGSGFDTDAVVKFNDQTLVPVSDHPNFSMAIIDYPLNLRNGPVTVISNEFTSNPFDIKLKPILKEITSAPANGGEVTIRGQFLNTLRYNNQPNTIVATLGSVELSVKQGANNTELITNVPPGFAKNILFSINIDQNPGLNTLLFSYEKPRIESLSIQLNQLRYTVKNIGTDKSKVYIQFGSINPPPEFELDGEIITFTIPPDTLSGGVFIVSVVGGQSSDPYTTVLDPIINSIDPVPMSGGQTVIKGVFLNNSPQSTQIFIGDSIECINPIVYPTYLTCNVPAGTGLKLKTVVTTTSSSKEDVYFNYGPSTTSASNPDGSENLYIIGENYDTNSEVTFVGFDSVANPFSTVVINSTYIKVSMPSVMRNTDLIVTSNGLQSNSVPLKLTPLLETIDSVAAIGGDVTLTGNYLNTKRMDGSNTNIVVSLGTYVCTPIFDQQPYYSKQFLCTVGPGLGNNHVVSLSIDGVVAKGHVVFGYDKLTFTTAEQSEKNFLMNGYGFGSDLSKISVKLNNEVISSQNCQFTIPNKQIKCPLTKYSMSGPVELTVNTLE
eukprot:gene10350-12712_t